MVEQFPANSLDIGYKTPLERYEDRPVSMEGVTSRNYTIHEETNYEQEHVMLYLPFCKEVDILDGNAFKKMFDDNQESTVEVKQRYSAGVTIAELMMAHESISSAQQQPDVVDDGSKEIGPSTSAYNSNTVVALVETNDNSLITQVHLLSREIQHSRMTEPFGGFDVILSGDMEQLPPVRPSEVYKRPRKGGSVYNTGVLPSHHLSYFPLT
ncbi:hypothetical protein V5799_024105 [Amblyomma americanum]|uniref:DNA helicase n=1 Tax=Amblyomma americanum TaxID=6943 RepID=A0AAQ4EDE0_AMBAM